MAPTEKGPGAGSPQGAPEEVEKTSGPTHVHVEKGASAPVFVLNIGKDATPEEIEEVVAAVASASTIVPEAPPASAPHSKAHSSARGAAISSPPKVKTKSRTATSPGDDAISLLASTTEWFVMAMRKLTWLEKALIIILAIFLLFGVGFYHGGNWWTNVRPVNPTPPIASAPTPPAPSAESQDVKDLKASVDELRKKNEDLQKQVDASKQSVPVQAPPALPSASTAPAPQVAPVPQPQTVQRQVSPQKEATVFHPDTNTLEHKRGNLGVMTPELMARAQAAGCTIVGSDIVGCKKPLD